MRRGGYVMVTRGLLALLDDEAELAAALSHEVGHVVQRHASQRARQRQSVLDAAVEAATSTGSITVGRSVARDGLLALRRYSREQELEADKIGVAMLVKAGYRGSAMASLIDKLRRQGQLELQLMGEAAQFDRSAQHDLDPSRARRTAHRAAGRQRRLGAGRVPSHGLSRRHQRHVGRRPAAGRLCARQSLSPSRAEAGLRGAARLPPVQRHRRRPGRRPRPLAAVLLLHRGSDAGQPRRLDAQPAEAHADRHPDDRDRRRRGRDRRTAARLRHGAGPGALRPDPPRRSRLLLQSPERRLRPRSAHRGAGQRRPHLPQPVRCRSRGPAALPAARRADRRRHRGSNSPSACPTPTTRWSGCCC